MSFREDGPKQPRSPEVNTEGDYYERLGVRRDASQREINDAFRRLSRILHPDAPGGNEEAMKAVTEAHTALKDPDNRAAYDRTLPRMRTAQSSDFARERSPETEKPPKPPERHTAEQIKAEAIHLASGYASGYRKFVEKMKADGYPDMDDLIHLPEVVEAIKKRALNEAWKNALSYDLTVGSWANVGFDRSTVDSSPELLEIIHRGLLSDVPFPTMFGNRLREWEQYNPVIKTADILAQPQFIDAIKNEAEKARQRDVDDEKRYGRSELSRDRWFNNFVERWKKEADIDVLELGI